MCVSVKGFVLFSNTKISENLSGDNRLAYVIVCENIFPVAVDCCVYGSLTFISWTYIVL